MSTEPSNGHTFRDPVWIGTSVILILHFVTSFWPAVTFWGIDYWSEFSAPFRVVMLMAGLILVFPPLAARISAWVTGMPRPGLAAVLATVILAGLMVVYRTRALAYGDAYSILAVIENPVLPALIGNLRFQPLDLYAHWAAFEYIVAPLGGTVETTYAILGALCGMAGIAAIVRIARGLSPDRPQRLFIVMCGLTSGCAFLWFGHVESYTIVMTASLWVVAVLAGSKEHRKHPALAWLFWFVAVASHALAVVLLPAVLWGSWKALRKTIQGTRMARARVVVLLGFAAGAAAAATGQILNLKTFVPFYPLSHNHYSVVSWAHLLDMANLILLTAPVVLLLPGVLRARATDRKQSDSGTVLSLAVLGLGLFAFWIDPMLGGFRDWDLLGAFGIPLSLLCGRILVTRLGARARSWWFVPAAVLALAHTGTWVAVNQDELQSVRRVERLVWEDAHYDGRYYQGGRHPVWGLILTNWLGEHARASEHFIYRLRHDPKDAVTWANLGITYQHRQMMDSALVCYGMAMRTDQDNPLYALAYGQVEHSMRHFQLAQVALERAAELAPGLYEAQMALGQVYRDLQMLDEAERRARLALQLDSVRPDANLLLQEIEELRGERTEPE